VSAYASSTARIEGELARLTGRRVEVVLTTGRVYEGILKAYEYPTLTLLLASAEEKTESKQYPAVIITGNVIAEIRVKEVPLFDAREFAEYLIRRLGLRPDAVRVHDKAGVVTVYNTIRVSESGVEGSGGLVSKVDFVFKEYIEKKRRGERIL